MDRSHTFKTVFLGDSNVGKTCLARMFVDREVLEQSCNTIGFDHHVRQIEVEEDIFVKVRGDYRSTVEFLYIIVRTPEMRTHR